MPEPTLPEPTQPRRRRPRPQTPQEIHDLNLRMLTNDPPVHAAVRTVLNAVARTNSPSADQPDWTDEVATRLTDLRGHTQPPTGETANIMFNQQTPAETLREQRAIIRTLRKEHPTGRRMIILKDGTRPTYQQATHKGKRCDLYELPCDEFKCNISLLTPDMIDVQATRALWSGKPSQYQAPLQPYPIHEH